MEGERLYGDGVNIAARLESLAIPGGICISGTVYDHVKTKLALHYEDLGAQTVKNIAEPVRVYRVVLQESSSQKALSPQAKVEAPPPRRVRSVYQWAAAGLFLIVAIIITARYLSRPSIRTQSSALITQAAPSLPLPDKPSIAVLPFTNMSGDPEQEYFSDGMTEAIS